MQNDRDIELRAAEVQCSAWQHKTMIHIHVNQGRKKAFSPFSRLALRSFGWVRFAPNV